MKHRLPLFLIPLILVCAAAPALVAQEDAEPLSCADRSIVASAVHTLEDIQVFVQCAYEFVQEAGFEEARRAFHEEEFWRSGPTYIFVAEAAPVSDQARRIVFPPDPSREGLPRGLTRISILALARSQDTPPLRRIPRLFALNPAHHLRR